MRHPGRRDAQDAFGRRDRVEVERIGDPFAERGYGRSKIERHLAAEKTVDAQPAEHQIGVGDRRLLSAEAVAHRARLGAGALRTDTQRTTGLDAGDAAAAGADLLNVNHRHLNRQPADIAADHRIAGHQHLTIMNNTGLGSGAAHIEGDGAADAGRVAQRLGADHAGGGP